MTDLAVIMSVYQNDKLTFLKESVQSILNQSFRDFDFFITFDGPVSNEIELYLFKLEDERIKLYRLEKNEGLASALNYMLKIVLKNSDYEFIARMDADDISFPTRLEMQRTLLLEKNDISVVGCWYQQIDEYGKHLSYRKLPVDHNELKKLYYTKAPFAHSSVMYRKNLIEKAGLYPLDAPLMEDNVLWGNTLIAGLKIANIPEYLLKYRIDKNFFVRRSGITYGWNFIKKRLSINRSLKFPAYSYMLICFIGLIKMLPSFVLKFLYLAARKG